MKKWMKLGLVVVAAMAFSMSLVMVGCSCSSDATSKSTSETSSTVDASGDVDDDVAMNSTSLINDTKNMVAIKINLKEDVSDADGQALLDKIKQVPGVSDAEYVNAHDAHLRGYSAPYIEYAFADDQDINEIVKGVYAIEGFDGVVEREIEQASYTSAQTGEEEKGTYELVHRTRTTSEGIVLTSIDYVLVEEEGAESAE